MVTLAKNLPQQSAAAAFVTVDGRKVEGSMALPHGSLIRIGQNHAFRLCVPPSFGVVPQNGGGMTAARDKLQLPLVGVTASGPQPPPTPSKKSSPDFPPGNCKRSSLEVDSVIFKFFSKKIYFFVPISRRGRIFVLKVRSSLPKFLLRKFEKKSYWRSKFQP